MDDAVIRKLRATLSDGSTHTIQVPDGVDPREILLDLVAHDAQVRPWIESEAGAWIRSDAIVSLVIQSEDQFSLGDIVSLRPEEQVDFFSRHPVPRVHEQSQRGGQSESDPPETDHEADRS